MSGFYRRDFKALLIQYVSPTILLLIALEVFFPRSFHELFPDPVDTVLIVIIIVLSLGWIYDLTQRPNLRFQLSPAIKERPEASIEISNNGRVVAKSDVEIRIDGVPQGEKGTHEFGSLRIPIFSDVDIEPKEKLPLSSQLRYVITFSFHNSTNSFRIHWENKDPKKNDEDEVKVLDLPKGQYRFRLVTKWESFGKRQILSKQYYLNASDGALPILREDKKLGR